MLALFQKTLYNYTITIKKGLEQMEISKEELQTSHDYWVSNYNEKSKSIDKLCVRTAERLGEIDYQLWRDDNGDYMAHERRAELLVERRILEETLLHFHGFVDKDYVKGHDLSSESITRHKSRNYRYYNNILGA